MTYKVILTGGIGTGKTTTAEIFASFGVPIIDADVIAKECVLPSEPAFGQIIHRWGLGILQEDGNLNRQKIRKMIFNNPEDKKWLENLLHPIIFDQIINKIEQVSYPYCLIIVPLLAEDYARFKPIIDYVIVMDAHEDQQLAWASMRDKNPKSLIKKIIQCQTSREKRLQLADTVLVNDGTLVELKEKITELHRLFYNKGKALKDSAKE
jgi:dephospho-CoA kinase